MKMIFFLCVNIMTCYYLLKISGKSILQLMDYSTESNGE